MIFTETMEHVARGFEVIGAAILVLGLVWSVVLACRTWRIAGGRIGYRALRESFGEFSCSGWRFWSPPT
jgi:hypothetical protein